MDNPEPITSWDNLFPRQGKQDAERHYNDGNPLYRAFHGYH